VGCCFSFWIPAASRLQHPGTANATPKPAVTPTDNEGA